MKNIVGGLFKNMKKLHLKDQSFFLTKISEMLEKGFTLRESLDFLGRTNEGRMGMFQSMTHALQSGQPIFEVFYMEGFDHQACTQLYFAERHGYLVAALKESGEYLRRKDDQRKKLVRLLQYPVILAAALIIVSLLLQTLLLPRFQMFYDSMGYKPNFTLSIFLHIMQTFPIYFLFTMIVALTGGTYFFKFLSKKSALERAVFFSRIPGIQTYYKLYQTVFLAREWSFLLKSGFSINEIIQIMQKQEFHPLLKESAIEIRDMLTFGYSFSEAVSNLGFVEEELMVIVAHGEKSGKLEGELMFYSQFCLQRLEEKFLKVFLFIQPLVFALIGLMVIAIYLSIFLPMFEVIDSI
ncbi:competence type IV pilus assembly protein ComGB [Siminovitchia terrae]|nr:competence type IV pilus assembly protein ComGB [Siminovitchia terrae]RST61436.1 type II secretion system F family protein [Siminovitchia terrae]